MLQQQILQQAQATAQSHAAQAAQQAHQAQAQHPAQNAQVYSRAVSQTQKRYVSHLIT